MDGAKSEQAGIITISKGHDRENVHEEKIPTGGRMITIAIGLGLMSCVFTFVCCMGLIKRVERLESVVTDSNQNLLPEKPVRALLSSELMNDIEAVVQHKLKALAPTSDTKCRDCGMCAKCAMPTCPNELCGLHCGAHCHRTMDGKHQKG